MRLSSLLIPTVTFAAAAGLSLVAAGFAVTAVERGSEIEMRRTLDRNGFTWTEVTADGLRVILEGTAPDEASRFAALSLAGGVVDAARVIDGMIVPPSEGIAPPKFSAEILRNSSGISIIGLIPTSSGRETLVRKLNNLPGAGPVADLLEAANYVTPKGWSAAMDYAIDALELLPRAKISVEANAVAITAMVESGDARSALTAQLTRMAPPELRLALDISAPRPVITPFTLRFLIDANGKASFDACSAESAESRDRILDAARQAGLTKDADCVIGMGVPSPNWAKAAELSIASLAELGVGTVTIANADITLVAQEGTDTTHFDTVIGELENALPTVFALHAVLPETQSDTNSEPSEFTATLSPEGQVQLRGRVGDAAARDIMTSYAKARFSSESVHTATRVASDLPADWSIRVLAGLEALSKLERGSVTVTADNLTLRGVSHREDASAQIAGFLSAKLGETATYQLDVKYEEPPAPENQPMAPELCAIELAAAQRDIGKISFEPGSATVAADSIKTIDRIVEVLEECGPIRLEIQGHTDSQGREEMNQNLSQSRAQSVLNELRARRLLTSTYFAKGYGESQPIATNDTEEGREANRRIEFHLVLPETAAEEENALDGAASDQPVEDAGSDNGTETEAPPPQESPEATPEANDSPDAEQAETAEETAGQ